MCSVSVVIPTFQRGPSVLRTLQRLTEQTLPADTFEVIVSVDGSTDGTLEAVRAFVTPYALTALWQTNRGRASACNAGIRAAQGDLLVLLDDDMEPSNGFLEAHREAHRGRWDLGVLGAVPVRIPPSAPPATRFIGSKFNGHLRNLARPEYEVKLTDFYSGNFSIARDAIVQAGGFDEDFRLYGNEDLELSLRLKQAGCTFRYVPEALAYQHNEKTFGELAADSQAEGRTAVLFATKHPEAYAYLRLGSYPRAPLPLRALRSWLLALERAWPGFPDAVVRSEAWAARIPVPGRHALYSMALGYFYWLGVRSALAEGSERVREVPQLRALSEVLQA